MRKVYLDHAATTSMDQAVVEEMVRHMSIPYGNPSSLHSFGREARFQLSQARTVIAKSIGAKAKEITFTSGGTESDNLAIFGVTRRNRHEGNHIITTAIEHHAVLHAFHQLEKEGFEVTYLPVNEFGRVQVEDVRRALRPDTILVSMMYGNNEVGTIQPISEVGALLKEHQAVFHVDAVQAYGTEAIDVNVLNIDLLSASAHKIKGPKGIGFLYVREGVKLQSQTFGGQQENKRRAGTENVPTIVGFKKAVEIMMDTRESRVAHIKNIHDYFIQQLRKTTVAFEENVPVQWTLPHILNIYIPGIKVESFLVNLDLAGIAASSGSACTAGSMEPSHVLVAMFGQGSERTHASLRFSFGVETTKEDCDYTIEQIGKIIAKTGGNESQ